VRRARDVDDPRRAARDDPVEQQAGEQVVPEVVRAELDLEPVLRHAALAREAGVVDEAVDRELAREQLAGARAHRREVAEVERHELDPIVAGLAAERLDDRQRLRLRAARRDDVRASPRELERRDLADAAACSGDDEGPVRQVTVRMLAEAGYRVLAAEDGDSALRRLEPTERIDLLVADVVTPGMGGQRLAERILARDPRTLVLFISGYTAEAQLDALLARPGVTFLAKPFTAGQLQRAVRELLDSSRRS
jgi:CheY-like chemotaxis protein